ncbi:MAG: sigma 54-dependent Fis family transcriptional regulator [Alphaproteobacteria bacterium]|nr:sigma 54-dependent Fis family transcriptional regulator [Alphaproteobacteria bacterium]MCB9794685.1 sigma 54-dependent Fis family transcriptional regulator [Alphaproteobacteria bacterium]
MSDVTSTIAHPYRRQIHLRRGRLTCASGADQGKSWLIDHDVVRIGSMEDNDVTIHDSTASRRHAEIARTKDGVLLRDLGSTNGTFVGPVRVREVFLTPETRFRIGRTDFVFTPEDEVIEITPSEKDQLDGLVGASVAMRELFSIIERVAPTDLTALITGETGTGKELASRALHNLSHRAEGPFRVFDCGAAPETLIESELFGHEKGSFTGAHAAREGVFESADGGTIFLDEIGELPLELQPKLLRVLEQREVRRVGAGKTRAVDVRVVAATNRDLLQEVRAGRFREDLYYRLAVVELTLPALRERKEDLPLLIDHLLHRAQRGVHRVRGASPEVLELLESYRFPGNVRELANLIERAIPFTDGAAITLEALPDALRGGGSPGLPVASFGTGVSAAADLPFKDAKERLIDAFERSYLVDLIDRHDGNVSKAARAADMDRKSITRLLKKHNIR